MGELINLQKARKRRLKERQEAFKERPLVRASIVIGTLILVGFAALSGSVLIYSILGLFFK